MIADQHLFYIEEKEKAEEDSFYKDLHLNHIEKRNGNWELINDITLDIQDITLSDKDIERHFKDYIDLVRPVSHFKEMQIVSLSGKDYLFGILQFERTGTAYSGNHEYLFIFEAIKSDENPVLYYYSRAEYEKDFTLRSATRDSNPNTVFYQYVRDFVKKNLTPKKPSYHLEEQEVFKWRDLNPHLFENLRQNQSSSIRFITYDSDQTYEHFKTIFMDSEVENEKYKAFTGFRSPVFVYDKKNQKSLLVFIPDAWPNGGAWGIRSCTVRRIKDHKLYLNSGDEVLIINLETHTIESHKPKREKS